MSDQTEDELVRRLNRRPKGALIGVLAVLGIIGAVVLMLGPIAMQPSLRDTLPKAFEQAETPEEPPMPPKREKSDQLAVDINLPEGLPPGVRTVLSQSVVVAVLPLDGTEGSVGNGLLVRDGIVLAPAHFHTSPSRAARFQILCNGKVVAGTLRKQAEVRDIAVIAAPGCAAARIRVSRKRVTRADTLYLSGFLFTTDIGGRRVATRQFSTTSFIPDSVPDVAELQPEAAELLRAMRKKGVPPLMAVRETIMPGQSGSPVTLENGDLVGMMILNYPRKTQSYMVPATSIARILRDAGVAP